MKKMSDEAFYESPRLKKAMEKLSSFPYCFIVAGAGYGKSLLARRYLANQNGKGLYFLFTGKDLSSQYERFLWSLEKENSSLADALRLLPFPGDEWSFHQVASLLRGFLKDEPFTLCLDDCQEVAKDPAFLFALKAFEEEKLPSLHFLILSREVPALPFASWRLKNEVGYLEGKDLALREEECGDFLRFRGLDLSEELVRKIHQESEGWVAALELYARGLKQTGSLAKQPDIEALFKEAFYGALKEKERLLLIRLSPFEEFTLPFAEAATGSAESPLLLQTLLQGNSFVSETDGYYRFHSLFREFLLQECPDDEEEKRVYRRAGFYLFEKNDPAQPFLIEWFLKAGAVEELFSRMNDSSTHRWDFLSLSDLNDCLASLPKDAYRLYPYAYLNCLFLFFVWQGGAASPYAKSLYEEMENYYGDGKHRSVAAELALLKRLFFPDPFIDGIDPLYRIGHDLLPKGTMLLRKDDPFTYGLPMLLESEYFLAGHLSQDLQRLSDNAYARVCPGFGEGSEELAAAEGALLQGEMEKVPSFLEQCQREAGEGGQSSVLVSASFIAMVRSLYFGKIKEAETALEKMRQLVSAEASRKSLRPVSRSRLLEQYWLSSSLYGAFTHDKSKVPSGVFLGEEKDYLLNDGLGVGKAIAALVMYSFGDYAGAEALTSLLLRENNISLLPRLDGMIIQGLAKEHLEGTNQGWPLIKQALLLGEKDQLILPFAGYEDLLPFLQRFASLSGGNPSYRTRLLHDALYHQSVFPHFASPTGPSLTKREKQLLLYLEQGKSRLAIAQFLYVQENTIKTELSSLYKKLGVHSRNEALAAWHK
jgi:LuxR family maltose regulon positive regulatory protein